MFTSATGYIFSFGLSRRRHEPPFKPGGSVGALVGRPGFRAGFARIRARGRGRGSVGAACSSRQEKGALVMSLLNLLSSQGIANAASGAAFSTPMSVALQRRLPRRRPPCPCCKFTSSTAISTELAINAWWISLHVPPSPSTKTRWRVQLPLSAMAETGPPSRTAPVTGSRGPLSGVPAARAFARWGSRSDFRVL